MGESHIARPVDAGASVDGLLALYDEQVDDVYGFVLRRCGDVELAEDIGPEAFVAAACRFRRYLLEPCQRRETTRRGRRCRPDRRALVGLDRRDGWYIRRGRQPALQPTQDPDVNAVPPRARRLARAMDARWRPDALRPRPSSEPFDLGLARSG